MIWTFYDGDDSQSDFPLNVATLLRLKFNCKTNILVEKMEEGRRVCANASEPLFLLFFESFKFGEMKRHELERTGESRLLTSSPDRVQQMVVVNFRLNHTLWLF